jgi:hypothetical protein
VSKGEPLSREMLAILLTLDHIETLRDRGFIEGNPVQVSAKARPILDGLKDDSFTLARFSKEEIDSVFEMLVSQGIMYANDAFVIRVLFNQTVGV